MVSRVICLGLLYMVLYQQITSQYSTLNFNGKRLTSVQNLKTWYDIRKVTTLCLAWNRITEVKANAFVNYTSLECLYLMKNRITRMSPSALCGIKLRFLQLSANALTCIPDLSVVNNTLTILHININHLYRCTSRQKYRVKFKRLETISMESNKLTHLRAMTILWAAPNLKFVHLGANKLKQVPNFSQMLARLEMLRLKYNPIQCSCDIKWLKQIECTELRMICHNFGSLSGRTWNSLKSLELEKNCQASTTAQPRIPMRVTRML